MYQPYKYRLGPFRNQQWELCRQLEDLKFLWNHALEERIGAWRNSQESLSYVDQNHHLTRWRNYDKDRLGRVYNHVTQDCLQRLDDAFKHFFRRVKAHEKPGFPHFKSEVTSLTYPDAYNGSVAITEGRCGTKRLHLAKIGDIPIKIHREPPGARVKTCTVEREGDKWYAILTYEVPDPAPQPTTPPQKPIGIDLGLTSLATLSTGEKMEPPKFLLHTESHLKRQQRVLSRREKGSHRREKQRIRVACIHAKIRDQRRDFAHKLTTRWANTYDLIAFEDMDLRSLARTHTGKSMLDAGWAMLRQYSSYKQRNRSQRYVEVPTKDTTQSCSQCGERASPPLTLKDRVFQCPRGHVEDRDVNAARNVLKRALAIVRGGTPETTPVETGPPPTRRGRRVRSSKQEPSSVSQVAL